VGLLLAARSYENKDAYTLLLAQKKVGAVGLGARGAG
jgi:hypothetical protein